MKNLYFSLILLLSFTVMSQDLPPSRDMQQLSSLTGQESSSTDLEQWAMEMEDIAANPIFINFANAEDLSRLGLDVFQINNLLQFRYRTGFILSPYELVEIKGWNKELVEKLQPFINFSSSKPLYGLPLKRWLKYRRQKIMFKTDFDLQKRDGFKNNVYAGNPGNYQLRYKLEAGRKLSGGLHLQHDAGEAFSPYPDFFSFTTILRDYNNWKEIIIGDYQVEMGQGLAFWSSFTMGKSTGIHIKRFDRDITSYQGGNENRFLRGIASRYRWGKVDITAFYSLRHQDARLEYQGEEKLITSLPQSGLHRTESELANKDQAILQIGGMELQYQHNFYSLGIRYIQQHFNYPIAAGKQVYQRFNLQGPSLGNFSADWNVIYRDLNIFGELAFSKFEAMAFLSGIQSQPADRLHLSLLYRYFQPEYQALYNAPFADAGKYGERGFYFAMNWKAGARLDLEFSLDNYYFTWPAYGKTAPSTGTDINMRLNWKPMRYLEIQLKHRTGLSKTSGSTDDDRISASSANTRSVSGFQIRYSLSREISLTSHISKSYAPNTGSGLLIYQDLHWKRQFKPFSSSVRISLSDIPDFSLRLYAYEYDLSYSFSAPSYYGQAVRFYWLGKYALGKKLQFQLKFSHTYFTDRAEISSGNNLIEGNKLTEFRSLIIYKF